MSNNLFGSTLHGELSKDQSGIEQIRDYLVDQLPAFLAKALRAYHRFSMLVEFDDPKSFSAHQSACRAALAHIQLLIKLNEWLGSDRFGQDAAAVDEEFGRLLTEARINLSSQEKETEQDF